MSFTSLLINECAIKRFTDTGTDDYGQPIKVWETILGGIDCRYVSGKGTEIKVGQEVVIVYDELFIGDVDITEQDRIVIGSLTYEVLSVVIRQDGIGTHHKHLYLEIVK